MISAMGNSMGPLIIIYPKMREALTNATQFADGFNSNNFGRF